MRNKSSTKNTKSVRLWTWRPGFAAQFTVPSTWLEPNEPRDRSIVLTRGEEIALDRAFERWDNEGGRDEQPTQSLQSPDSRVQPKGLDRHPPPTPGGGE